MLFMHHVVIHRHQIQVKPESFQWKEINREELMLFMQHVVIHRHQFQVKPDCFQLQEIKESDPASWQVRS